MKVFENVLKILTVLAAVAGAVYAVATYGDKIVAWAKSMMAKCPVCSGKDDAPEAPAEEAAEAPAEEAPAEETAPVAEEAAPVEEAPEAAEAPAAEDAAPVADEADFQG